MNHLSRVNKRYVPIYLVALAGVILAIVAFRAVRHVETKSVKAEFNLVAQDRVNAVKREIETSLEAVKSLHSFYLASQEVTRAEFRQFTAHLLGRHPSIQALEWIPRITLSQRNLYEERARGEYPDFQITEQEELGTMIRAREREEYFPVYFVEPYNGNRTALGFDLASNPTRLKALNHARDSGMIAATERITLVQKQKEQYGFLVFIPVYQKNDPLNTFDDGRSNLHGFVVGVFSVGEIVERSYTYRKEAGIDIHLYDVSASEEGLILYRHLSQRNSHQNAIMNPERKDKRKHYIENTLNVADKTWKITGVPDSAFYASAKDWHAGGASAGVLFISFMIALYLKKMLGQSIYSEGLVRKLGDEINVRREVADALKKSDKEFRALFENMSEGFAYHRIIVDDRNRPVDYEFILVNNSFEKATGIKADDALGKKVTEIIPGIRDSKPDLVALYGEVAQTGNDATFELYFEPFDRWYLVKAYSPRKDHFVAIFDDISDRKKAEQERERLLSELTSKNNELQQILYVTSHDLRSPLVNVDGFSRELNLSLKGLISELDKIEIPPAIKERIDSIIQGDVVESLHYISKSISRMDLLIKGLLSLSRLGQIELNIKQIDMNELVVEVVSNFEFRIKELGVKVNISKMPTCRGDSGQISQVFSNLLDNAMKHLDSGQQGIITISGYQENHQSHYCIEDNGIGIAPDHHEKIFKLFHQLDPGKTHGEGLGLTIAHRIVERHHGKIWVESEPGKGSRFYVSLPG